MKKHFFVGLFFGLLLASAIPAYGAVSSMVGKQVQAENYVVVDNQILNVKAVNIDGTTYSPNRAIADALGMDIRFDDGKVYFDSKVGSDNYEKPIEVNGGDELSKETILQQMGPLQLKINEEISKYSGYLAKESLKTLTDEDRIEYQNVKERLAEYQQQMDELQSQLEAQSAPAQ